MPDSNTPLLERERSSSDASEDLERGLHSGADHDFRHLIDSQPEAVIKYVFTHSFAVQLTSPITEQASMLTHAHRTRR